MSENEHTTPHRRGLLTGTIAALLAGTAAVATGKAAPITTAGDDAELLALCAEFHEAHAAAYAVPTDDDEALHEAMGVR